MKTRLFNLTLIIFIILCIFTNFEIVSAATEEYIDFSTEQDSSPLNATFKKLDNGYKFEIILDRENIQSFKTAEILVALYDDNKKLIKTHIAHISSNDNSTSNNIITDEKISSYKLMLLDSIGSLKPLCTKSIGINVEKTVEESVKHDLSTFSPVNILENIEIKEQPGFFWGSSGTTPVQTQYTAKYTAITNSDGGLIDVISGHTYRIPAYRGIIAYYDANGQNREQETLNTNVTADVEFTVPEGKTKIGLSYLHDGCNGVSSIYRITPTLEELEKLPFYIQNMSIMSDNLKNKEIISLLSPLKGKTIVNFGDSIFGNARPPYDISTKIAELTGATVYNCGFGGCRMSEHQVSRYDAFGMYRLADAITTNDYSLQDAALLDEKGVASYFSETLELLKTIDFNSVDIITIAYGFNDWSGGWNTKGNRNLSEPASRLDYHYFKGALRYSIETILNKYPHIRIFICGQTYAVNINETKENGNFVDTDEWTKNNFKLSDCITQSKDVADEYKLPFIDNYSIGINILNWKQYISLTDGIHHNQAGRDLIASHIAKHLY